MANEKREQTERLAAALRLTVNELRLLRRQIGVADSNLTGTPKAERAALVARRLSITPAELGTLRAALNDRPGAASVAARVLAGHVIGLPALRPTLRPAPPKRPQPLRGPSVIATHRAGTTPKFFRDWNADTNVFVTTLGSCVHMYADCSGMRGFRHAAEPDPLVYQARLRDPVCRDRAACRKCFDVWSPSSIDRLDELLEGLHGKRRTASAVARSKSGRPPVRGSVPIRSRTAAQRHGSQGAKSERDRVAAAKLGITVQQLRTRRRSEHEANRRKRQG